MERVLETIALVISPVFIYELKRTNCIRFAKEERKNL